MRIAALTEGAAGLGCFGSGMGRLIENRAQDRQIRVAGPGERPRSPSSAVSDTRSKSGAMPLGWRREGLAGPMRAKVPKSSLGLGRKGMQAPEASSLYGIHLSVCPAHSKRIRLISRRQLQDRGPTAASDAYRRASAIAGHRWPRGRAGTRASGSSYRIGFKRNRLGKAETLNELRALGTEAF